MPKLRILSGREVLTILREFGFQKFGQSGSHIKVRRVLEGGVVQTLTIPNHAEIDLRARRSVKQRPPHWTKSAARGALPPGPVSDKPVFLPSGPVSVWIEITSQICLS